MRLSATLALACLAGSCQSAPPTSSVARAGQPAPASPAPPAARPAEWATPLERPGVPNLFEVEPGLYRSAQPTREGFAELERMGLRTVVNLRGFHDDDLPRGSSLDTERIRFHTWHAEDEDVQRFLELVRDPALRPLLVHCKHGADRTGMMLAVYRVVDQGWTKDEAIREMTEGGYGFHEQWQNLVDYVRVLDVERYRTRPVTR